MKWTIVALALAAVTGAQAQSQAAARPNEGVYRSGGWFVVRSVRDFGNVVACTGFYKGHAGVQLSKENMIVKTTAEMRSIAVGYDDQAPGAARGPTTAEKDLHAIVFAGPDFEKLRRSSKLTIALTTDKGAGTHVFDLRGLQDALANIDAGCPVPETPLRARAQPGEATAQAAQAAPAAAAEPAAPAAEERGKFCGRRLLARMRAAGVTEDQVRAICER